jgi:hypothetical protein
MLEERREEQQEEQQEERQVERERLVSGRRSLSLAVVK